MGLKCSLCNCDYKDCYCFDINIEDEVGDCAKFTIGKYSWMELQDKINQLVEDAFNEGIMHAVDKGEKQ